MQLIQNGAKPRQQLPQDVAKYVRELIISGRARKGEFLRIDALAKALNVSSTPVREGLLLLQSESFVKLVPRRGFVVLDFSPQDIRDLFWGQSLLAAELTACAARTASDAELDEIEALDLAYVAAVAAGRMEEAHDLGHRFHRAINLAARSKRLALLLAGMVRQLPNRFYGMMDAQVQDTMECHRRIALALRARDAECAREEMRAHIAAGAEHLITHLQAEGIWSESEAVLPTAVPSAAPPSAAGAKDPAAPPAPRAMKAATS